MRNERVWSSATVLGDLRPDGGVCHARHKCLACYRDSAPPRPRCRNSVVGTGRTVQASLSGWQLAWPVGCLLVLHAPAEASRRALLAWVGRVCVPRSFGKHDGRTSARTLTIRPAAFAPWIRASSGARAQSTVRVPCSLSHLHGPSSIDDRRASLHASSVSRTLDPLCGSHGNA